MHLKRWLTAIVLLPVLLAILLKGSPLVFTLLVCVLSLMGLKEYFSIVQPGPLTGGGLAVQIIAGMAALFVLAAAHAGSLPLMLLALPVNILALSFVVLVVYSARSPILGALEKQVQGVVYVPFFLSFLVLVRQGESGGLWIVWLWLVVGASDTGAFYCGRRYGRRPLSPRISPNKTVEGALGGLGAAVISGVIFGALFVPGVPLLWAGGFSFFAATAGQVGDLFESALKRSADIKDSGHILPGHGGILDRLDGLIFAAPVVYLFKVLVP